MNIKKIINRHDNNNKNNRKKNIKINNNKNTALTKTTVTKPTTTTKRKRKSNNNKNPRIINKNMKKEHTTKTTSCVVYLDGSGYNGSRMIVIYAEDLGEPGCVCIQQGSTVPESFKDSVNSTQSRLKHIVFFIKIHDFFYSPPHHHFFKVG